MATPFLSQPKFYAGADFNKTEAIGLLMQNLASAPSTPGTGRLYFDTTEGFAMVANASGDWTVIKDTWVSQVSGSGCVQVGGDRKSTRLNSSHVSESRMPSSA